MTDDNRLFDLTRRKMLGSIGALGLGAALGGTGTAAFFSDEETFENNSLVAGQLDLQVDWEEHYFDGAGVDDLDWHYSDPGDAGYVPLPTLEEPMVWVHEDDLAAFMNATAIEAYPDSNGDGVQDLILTRNQIREQNSTYSSEEVEQAFHDQFADVPQDLDRPVVSVEDVKPGDFGEVTFSTHLHNNPGYLWLVGDLIEASENGLTEPEESDPDEGEGVELLDVAKAAIWYDDGDNIREGEEILHTPHDVNSDSNVTVDSEESLLAMGSLGEVLESVSTGMGMPLDSDPTTEERQCYPNSTTYYFGFAWWLPVDHGNEVQTDSVTFDIGFYTEQCRHNDGSGMPAAVLDRIEIAEGFGTNSGDVYSLTGDAGYPENMVTTIRGGAGIEFELDLPKPLDDSDGDNWSLTFDADDDGTADFQVTYNDGFGYQEFDGSWGSASMPAGIQTSIENGGETYVVRLPDSMLGDTFRFGGQVRYNGEEPTNPGQNFVVNLVPGFSWGSGLDGDSSAYRSVTKS